MQAQVVQNEQHDVALPFRSHTIFGVCEAIGEDFGFNPMWLRVPFGAMVLVSPMLAIGAYLAVGVLVLASRLLFPKPKMSIELGTRQHTDAANEQREIAQAA